MIPVATIIARPESCGDIPPTCCTCLRTPLSEKRSTCDCCVVEARTGQFGVARERNGDVAGY